MAIRVFQPPRCQIYGGGEKRSQNAIAVGKGQSTFRERALPCSPKSLGISPFSLSAGCSESQRSVWPPMGWKRTWKQMPGEGARMQAGEGCASPAPAKQSWGDSSWPC